MSETAAHDPYLAHHFHSHQQQLASQKLGMWLFLATEVLLFGGLFVAYAVFRGNPPEIFSHGSQTLDRTLGTVNTFVLIFSSLTMALAVHSAALGNNKAVAILLVVTLICAGAFLGIKYVEYSAKFEHGLLWGHSYHPHGAQGKAPANMHLFYGIYFMMTGLHGVHVLIGMLLMVWLLVRALRGAFNGKHFAAVDLTGLYWHLVDLIWIFLFPLL